MLRIIVLCLLYVCVCTAEGDSSLPREPLCVCNCYKPSCDTGTDDKYAKKSAVVSLQAEMETLRQELKDITSVSNTKQCSIRNLKCDLESGVTMECGYNKKRAETVLRVAFNGALRLTHNGPDNWTCRRWYFTLNDKECVQPMTIDTQIWLNLKDTNIHKPHYVEGYCRGVPAGRVVVKWNVGDCVYEKSRGGDSKTGWGSTSRIIIEEIDVNNARSVIV